MRSDTSKIPHLRATLLLCCLAQFMVILDVSVVNVALPAIRGALHFSEQDLQWVVNAYTVTFAGFLLLGGRAADLLGRRRVFVAGLALFGLASLAGGVAQSQATLIAARAVQGLGGAVIAPASLSILTTTFEEGAARNRAVGIWGAMGGVGGAAGVLLGGVLTDLLGWRWILFINVPIGLAAALLAQRLIAEGRNPGAGRNFDLAGAITATAGLSLLVLGIVRTDVTGWGSASTLAVMGAGVLLIGAFVAIEGRFAKAPLMPLRIYESRTLSAANAVILLVGAAVFAMWFFVSLYLQQVLGYTPIEAGIAFLPMTVCIAGASTLVPRLIARVGAKTVLIAGHARPDGRAAAVHRRLPARQLPRQCAGRRRCWSRPASGWRSSRSRSSRSLAWRRTRPGSRRAWSTPRAWWEARSASRSSRRSRPPAPTPTCATAQPCTRALTSGFQLAFLVAAAFAAVGALLALLGLPRTVSRTARRSQPAAVIEG